MERPKNIEEFTMQQRNEFLNSFDIIMTDCDGVIWMGDTPIIGSLETLTMFQKLGKKVMFVSNNSTMSVEEYLKKLDKMGYKATPDQIVTPTLSIAWYLKKIGFKNQIFATCHPTFQKYLMENDNDIVVGSNNMEENMDAVRNALLNQSEIGAVIMDCDLNLNYIKMAQIQLHLQKKNVLFFCGARDVKLPLTKTCSALGPGVFINNIASSTGREPIEYAKPSTVLRDYILTRYEISNPARCIFVGDSLESDMNFAKLCGFKKLWVNSGVDEIDSIYTANAIPDYYLESLGTMPNFAN